MNGIYIVTSLILGNLLFCIYVEGNFAALKKDIGNLKKIVMDFYPTVTKDEGNFAALKRDIGKLKKIVMDFHPKVTKVESNFAALKKDIRNLKKIVMAFHPKVTKVESNFAALKKDIRNLKKIVMAFHPKVTKGTQCNSGWIAHGSSCYLIVQQERTWNDASTYCKSHQAMLAEIESSSENNFLKSTLHKLPNRNGTDSWIGGTDVEKEGTWRWNTSGSKLASFNDWYAGEPNQNQGEQENCMEMRELFGYLWNDSICALTKFFICEI